MAQPMVVSSCINYKWKYDVFLSFHGKDTRLGFVGFLRESLRQRGIHVFYDDDSIRTGEEITPALLKAIQESRIAIIVFSENYAESTFCLQELEKILEGFKEEGRLVYPVFYYVDPSELRRPRGSYAKALAGLEERFKDDKQKVEKWRLALSQAAEKKGCHLIFKNANEQECIKEIINEVSAKINRNHNPLHVAHYPVGLVSRVKQVVSLLDLWSEKKNKMVGIVGPGGIGKSTIARATYNSIGDHFEGLCFLSNVRQMSKVPNGLAHLQELLLCKLVMEKDLKLGDFYEGIPKIKHRLGHKKILLILDDVDELEQLEALAGSCDWFGRGSRIVITTRNKQLLVSHDVNIIYSVRELNNDESVQLLSWHAFKTENVEYDFMEVSKRAILYSCGFPLALEVIGSNLRGKKVKEWHSALDQFKKNPEERVLGVLRLSYDSLAEIEKNIFLDLACFFKGEELGEVKDMLLCLHGSQPEYAIGVLVDKSLIKIEGDRVLMHDLIEDMGKEIVRQESPNEPGKRSRLWSYQDILHVLKQNTGTNEVEVIVLDLPGGSRTQIQWSEKAFMKMTNLKMLVINNASFSKCPTHLPKSLRWLKWKGCLFKFLPYNISSTELFCLDLSCSYFDAIQPFTKAFHNLSRMNFRNCKFLQQIPNLSGVPNLRELWFDDCANLVEIHHSVGRLNKLKVLSAMRCKNLKMLPPYLRLTSLKHLNLFGCSSLHSFPDILVEMKYILTLDLGRTAIRTLPSSICNLIGLETLNIEECPYLEQLPITIGMLPNLWELNANFSGVMTHVKMCGGGGGANLDFNALSLKLKHFCFSNCNLSDDSLALCLSCFTSMIRLDLSFNNFTTLPACIKECHNLRYLLLNNCKRLQHIEEMPPNLEKFSAICCMSLTKSSESKILYQALNLQPGKRNFILPGAKFPENLHNYSRGSFVSFWIRDLFPTIFLWILVEVDQDFLSNCRFQVQVNDTKLDISSEWLLLSTMKMGHLYICDLQSMIHKAELHHRCKWNHVKVSIKSNTPEIKNGRHQFHFALHVYKQQNNSETIRFMDPRTMYEDSNLWQIVQQPQVWEELEDELPYQAPSVDNLKAKQALFPSGWTYDVLLSYRGDDECLSIFSHLYNSLCQRGIRTFVSDELVKTSREELKAIKESRTAIIVISKNYASSPSCLDSLATILECFRIECRVICPIFYDVEPLELQHQTGSYGEVFARLEKHNKECVQKWRLALYEAVDRSRGVSYLYPKNATGDEDAIESITDAISSRTRIFPLYVEKFPAHFLDESRVQEVISLVDVESNEEVKMVGISGGGIRRSALTHAVCNSIAHHFEDLWYFCGVRETARGYNSTWDDFQNWITQPWFPQRKILVILDSVKELDQLRAVRECNRFGEGSRIIVATSDKQLLVSYGFKIIFHDERNSLLFEKEKYPYKRLQEEEDLKAKPPLFPSGWTYDVFLSFRGDDVCLSFVRLLYNSLCQRGVRVFVNDELLMTSGEELKVIKESRTAIIVISEKYASSPSCLDSLATILECFRIECRVICPIFYDVEPLGLQHQIGSYGEVFARLEKHNKEWVQKWRSALYEAVGKSRGVSYLYPKNATGDEDAVESITDEISSRTRIFPLYVEKFPAHFLDESRVQEAILLVDVESNEEVKMVGISGGGIRRSALTHAVCNSIAHHFEDLWYFCGVREIARGYDSTWDDFQNWITQPWFPQRKILVILDSVKELDQLRAVRECNRFGEGSRIIVATSDKQLLVSYGFKIIFHDERNSLLFEKEKYPYKRLQEEEDLKAKPPLFLSGWTYDVFLSFRGDDVCLSFVRLLYNSLCQRGVRVFVNDELLMTSGEELKVIKESRTAIVVISEKYASSPSCLDSLATILECFRIECRVICPIFYDVEPLGLQHQIGSYGEVFARLEKHNKEWVQKWRSALYEAVGRSRGVSYLYPKNATRDEDAVESITDEISSRTRIFPLYVEKFPAHFLDESRVQEAISLVDVESNEEVKMVGISGGGIRRSALTHAVCNSIAHHFEDLWYFCGVREIARGYDSTWDDFQNWITQPWFPQRKILVILDSVKELDQLRAVRECNRFGEGSRIIVATSDKQLLVSHGFEIIFHDEQNSLLFEKEKYPYELLQEEEDLKAKPPLFPSGWTYDVFLSFRGDDVCLSFVRLLYNSLCQQGVRVFVNDELVMTSGEELKAIKESKTAIVVISEKYACSPSCLDSLAIILEFCGIGCRAIFPIFYGVQPLQLKHQAGSYGEVFDRLKKKFKHNKEGVKKWKLALSGAVESRGIVSYLDPRNATKLEDIIELIVCEASARIKRFPFRTWDDSLRLESRVQEIISLVDVKSNEEVKIVGIRRGISRSTMTLAVCNAIASHFDDVWYFCGDYEIASGYDLTLNDFRKWMVEPRVQQMKILVILDYVEELDLLRAVRECDRFDKGSRIIVVTSDKQLLVSEGIEIIMDEMEKDPNDQCHPKRKRERH